MQRPRVLCPACVRSIAVTSQGRLWPHRDRRGAPCPMRQVAPVVRPGGDEPVRLAKPVVNVISTL